MRAFLAGALALVVSIVVSPVVLASQGGRGGGGQEAPTQPTGVETPRAPTLGNGNPDAYAVPWQFLKPGAVPPKTPLTVYWFPASQKEIQNSDLLLSRELSYEASACVGMRGVLPEDSATIEKFDARDNRPLVLLVDSDGKVLSRVDSADGKLRVAQVEKMVKDAIGALDDGVYDQFVAARKKNDTGDKKGAIAIYRKIWSQRCLFSSAAQMAKQALEQLGVVVDEGTAARERTRPPATEKVRPKARPGSGGIDRR